MKIGGYLYILASAGLVSIEFSQNIYGSIANKSLEKISKKLVYLDKI